MHDSMMSPVSPTQSYAINFFRSLEKLRKKIKYFNLPTTERGKGLGILSSGA